MSTSTTFSSSKHRSRIVLSYPLSVVPTLTCLHSPQRADYDPFSPLFLRQWACYPFTSLDTTLPPIPLHQFAFDCINCIIQKYCQYHLTSCSLYQPYLRSISWLIVSAHYVSLVIHLRPCYDRLTSPPVQLACCARLGIKHDAAMEQGIQGTGRRLTDVDSHKLRETNDLHAGFSNKTHGSSIFR